MNRSYQHSYLLKNVSKQQTLDSITEIETLNQPSRSGENVEGSTTEIVFPRAIDLISGMGGMLGNRHQHERNPVVQGPTKRQQNVTESSSVTNHRIVDEHEWYKITRTESKRRKQVAKKQDRPLCEMLRRNSSALDSNGKLNLVSCYITEIDNLPDKLSQRVKTLYLSHNSLTNLLGLQQFSNLMMVSLANNSIRYLDALAPLSALTKVEKLTLEGNIVTAMPYYREVVLGMCCMDNQAGLASLDGVRVTPEEKSACRVNYRKAALQMEQMRCCGLRVAVLNHIEGLTRCHAEIVTQVVGRFRSMLGSHIDANSDTNGGSGGNSGHGSNGRRVSYICNTLRYALSGGVFRWLQITGGLDFERRSQDVAYRLFLIASKKMSQPQRNKLHTHPVEMTLLWDAISGECIQHQQQECLLLLRKCEESRELLMTACSGGSSGALRRSREQGAGAHDAGMLRLSIEKESNGPGGMIGASDAVSVLQAIQFEGMEPIIGTPLIAAIVNGKHIDRNDRHAWEVQITYCGLGPHYHLPVRDVLLFEEARRAKAHQEALRKAETNHQRQEHRLQIERSQLMVLQAGGNRVRNSDKRGEESADESADAETVQDDNSQQKYSRLLKQGLVKRATPSGVGATGDNKQFTGRARGVGERSRGAVITSVVKRSLESGKDSTKKVLTAKSVSSTTGRGRAYDSGDHKTAVKDATNVRGGHAFHADYDEELVVPAPPSPLPSPPRTNHSHQSKTDNKAPRNEGGDEGFVARRIDGFERGVASADSVVSSRGRPGGVRFSEVDHSNFDDTIDNDSFTNPPAQNTQAHHEDALLATLFSNDVLTFLALDECSSGEHPTEFISPSTEWAENLFSEDLFGISSEVLFAARRSLMSDQDSVEIPSSILGPPPVPWQCPSTAVTAAPSMRALNRLFDEGLVDADRIHRDARTVWTARLQLIKQTQRVAEQMNLSATNATEGLHRLALEVQSQRATNDQAVDWLRPVSILKASIEARRHGIAALVQRIDESRGVLELVQNKVNTAEERKEQLLNAADEVADAMVAMRDEMETSEHVRLAIRFHHINTLAQDFVHSTLTLKTFRRAALYMLRRRTTRQSKIRHFYKQALNRRRLETIGLVLERWKLFISRGENCAVACKWIRQSRMDKLFASWRRKFLISKATTIHNSKWTRKHLHSAIYIWRIGLRDRKRVTQRQAMKEKFALRFRLRWMMFYWRASVNQTNSKLMKHSNDVEGGYARTLGGYSADQIAERHFKHTLLLAWMKVSKRSRRHLLDRGAVLKTLYCRRLRDNAFGMWRSTHIAKRQWLQRTARRCLKAIRHMRIRKQTARYAIQRGCQFFVFKIQLIALKRLHRNARVMRRLRDKAAIVDEKYSMHVVIRAMSWWSTFASIESTRKEMTARAMGLYIFQMTKRVWMAWKIYHVGEMQTRSLRKAIATAEVERERAKDGEVLISRKAGRCDLLAAREDDFVLYDEDINSRINLSGEMLVSLLGRDHGKVGIDAVSDDESEYSPSEFGSDLSSINPPSPHNTVTFTTQRVYGKTLGRSRMAIARHQQELSEKIPEQRPADGLLPHLAVRRVKAAACLSWWRVLARRKRSLSTLRSIICQRTNERYLRRCFGVMINGWLKQCMGRVVAAGVIAEGEEDFDTRVTVAKEEVSSLRIKLEATRFSLDEQRSALAEKQSQAELLESALVSGQQRVDMCHMELENMRATEAEIRDKIEAIFITCSAKKSKGEGLGVEGADAIDVEAIYRRVIGRGKHDIAREQPGQVDEGKKGENDDPLEQPQFRVKFAINKSGELVPRPYANEIEAYMQTKLMLLADAEAEYKAVVSTNREKDREKAMLHHTVQQAFDLAYQCRNMLEALSAEGEKLAQQRRQAEITLRDCEHALNLAADRVGDKSRSEELEIEVLSNEHAELRKRQDEALKEETQLREILESLREEEYLIDKHLSEHEAAIAMGVNDSLAAHHTVHSTAILDSTRQQLSTQDIRSADSLREAIDSTVHNRVKISSKSIRGHVLPNTSSEEAIAIRNADNADLLQTLQQKLSAQQDLLAGAQNQSLYRMHAPANASAITGQNVPLSAGYEHGTAELRRSLSASSYNMRAPLAKADTVSKNEKQSQLDGASESSRTGSASTGYRSREDGIDTLNTQIQSLSSRIRSRLQMPPSL